MANKRLEGRVRKRLQVRYGTEGLTRIGFTDDISEEGICIKTAAVFPPQTTLQIEIVTSDNEIIHCHGKVRWAKKVPPQVIRKIGKAGMGILITRFDQGEEAFRRICREMFARV